MNDVEEFKLAAAAVVWALAIVGGVLPLAFNRSERAESITSVLNCVAAGIFLSGSCIHLLPDAQGNEALSAWMCEKEEGCFMWANFFYGVGFLVVLVLEVLAHSIQRTYGENSGTMQERTPLILNTRQDRDQSVDRKEYRGPFYEYETGQQNTSLEDVYSEGDRVKRHMCSSSEVAHAHIYSLTDKKTLLALVVFTALSFHSVMEGMGLGASEREAWDILIAIVAHKALSAFALSLEMAHHDVPRSRLLISITLFSFMTPVGVLLGWTITTGGSESVGSGITSALAGGTFLYVAAMEIIPQELQNRQLLLPKCFALCIGFGAMSLLSLWA